MELKVSQNNLNMAKRIVRKMNRKKAIPVYFQKNQASVSQILVVANYKRRIRELVKNNKELACTLQEVRCRVADQERALAEYNRESTKMMYVKTKVRDMVATVQKLVTDLDEVSNNMDGKTCDFLKSYSSSHDEVRLKIRVPSITTIEESASTSIIETDLSKEESINFEDAVRSVGTESKLRSITIPRQEISIPETSNPPLLLSTEAKSHDNSSQSLKERLRVSNFLECPDSSSLEFSSTPPRPVILPILTLKSSPNSLDPLQHQSQNALSPVKKSPKVTTSKIPRRTPTCRTTDPLPVPLNHFNRRETFVVKGIDNEPQIPLASADRRGTFVLNPAGGNCINERRATYLVPVQPEEDPVPTPPKVLETNPKVIVPNETVLLCEDMELTEIIPAQNQQCFPFQKAWNGETEVEGSGLIGKFLVPIDNLTAIADAKLDNPVLPIQLEMPKCEPTIKSSLNKDKQTTVLKKVCRNKISNTTNILSENKSFKSSVDGIMKEIDVAEPSANEKLLVIAKDTSFVESNVVGKSETLKSVPITHEQIQYPNLIKECDIQSVIYKNKLSEEKLSENVLNSEIENMPSKRKSRVSSLTKKKSGSAKKSDRISDAKAIRMSSKNQTARSSKSPYQSRRSCKKQSVNYDKFFDSDCDDLEDNFDEDFVVKKQFSCKIGRKIINPNNKKGFVFTKQQDSDKNIASNSNTDTSPDMETNEVNNIFNFSASSEAEKSPVKKPKKKSYKSKKSILPKIRKSDIKHPHTDKENSPDFNKTQDDISKIKRKIEVMPRKSILSSNKDLFNSQQSTESNRKSVRFTLNCDVDINDSNNSSFEINLVSNNLESGKELGEHLLENDHKSEENELDPEKKYCSNDMKNEKTKVKKTFSGISKRRSRKRSTLDDDFLSDLDNTLVSRGTLSKEKEASVDFVTEEPTEIYNVNDLMKPIKPETSKNNYPIEKKNLENQDICNKKDDLSMKNVLGEVQPDHFNDVTLNKKVLTLANRKCNPITNNKVLKLDILTCNNTTELWNSKNLPLTENSNPAEKHNDLGVGKKVEKSKPKRSRKRVKNENDDPNSENIRNVKSDVANKHSSVDLEPLPVLQNCGVPDVLCTANPMAVLDTEGKRPRRSRPVKSFKEPSLIEKMRR
ncbi:uncharacterized protein NPIL_351811 [Nephila pilipes]|uniref:Shugoshin C-terminal domain-containing protein n=1 Tax=Nephila pilipes TaxID=299642 RepID=A0A8X6QS26_NEPPI|nr:uncharacterized protein NPIL_351811 [Nephila pilipes]